MRRLSIIKTPKIPSTYLHNIILVRDLALFDCCVGLDVFYAELSYLEELVGKIAVSILGFEDAFFEITHRYKLLNRNFT